MLQVDGAPGARWPPCPCGPGAGRPASLPHGSRAQHLTPSPVGGRHHHRGILPRCRV